MVMSFIYIMATILGVLLGMSYIGFRYYKKRYNNIKTKYDEISGEDLNDLKNQNKLLEDEVKILSSENEKYKAKKKLKNRRKGLYKRTFIVNGDQNDKIEVECEVVELEYFRKKSRIEVLHVNCNKTITDNQRNQVHELVNGWYDDDDEIECFEKPLDEVRTNKIDDILETEEK